MVKKIMATGAAAAIFLSAAVPAFAMGWMPFAMPQDEMNVTNKFTKVVQDVYVKADTGDNFVAGSKEMPKPTFNMFGGGWNMWGKKGTEAEIKTGDAYVSGVTVGANVNSTSVDACGCFDDVTVYNKFTKLYQDVTVKALTGDNKVLRDGEIRTGDAGVMDVLVSAFVNTTSVGN